MKPKLQSISVTVEGPCGEHFFDLFVRKNNVEAIEKKLVATLQRLVAKDRMVVDSNSESLEAACI